MRIHATLPGPDLKNKKKSQDYKNFIPTKNSMSLLASQCGCVNFISITLCAMLRRMVIKEF